MSHLILAVAQTPIAADPVQNGEVIRTQMHTAKAQGARLVQFPEGAASGYSKSEIKDWAEVDWPTLNVTIETPEGELNLIAIHPPPSNALFKSGGK